MADKGLRGKRSNIWMFFSPVPNKLNKAKCDTCGKEYSYVGGSTSNLCLHIRTKHPSLVGSLPSKKRRTRATADVQAPVNAGEQGTSTTLDVKYLLLSENSRCLSLVECFISLHYHKNWSRHNCLFVDYLVISCAWWRHSCLVARLAAARLKWYNMPTFRMHVAYSSTARLCGVHGT